MALQEQVTQSQILGRLREHYGDRQSVVRYGRFVVRSFVAWGVLSDASKGCYESVAAVPISDPDLCGLVLEAGLHAMPEGQAELSLLLVHPGFFPFLLATVTGEQVMQQNDRVALARYGLDAELLHLTR